MKESEEQARLSSRCMTTKLEEIFPFLPLFRAALLQWMADVPLPLLTTCFCVSRPVNLSFIFFN